VGKNLKDHVGYFSSYAEKPGVRLQDGPIVEGHFRYGPKQTAKFQVTFSIEIGFLVLVITNLKPLASGSVLARSSNLLDDGILNWNSAPARDSEDWNSVKLAHERSFAAIESTGIFGPRISLAAAYPLIDVNNLGYSAQFYYHYGGTLGMGSSPDSASDSSGKVRGTTNVYVICGSAIPGTPYSHPSRETYANAMNIINGLHPELDLCNPQGNVPNYHD